MKTYDISVRKVGIERHTVDAEDATQALALFNEGKATLKDDETLDICSIEILDRATSIVELRA